MVTKIPPAKDSGFGRNHRKTHKSYVMIVSEGPGECAEERRVALAQKQSNLRGNTRGGIIFPGRE